MFVLTDGQIDDRQTDRWTKPHACGVNNLYIMVGKLSTSIVSYPDQWRSQGMA